MGNEIDNPQTMNQYPKYINNPTYTNKKRRTYLKNSNLGNFLENENNIMDFVIKVENGILLPNLNSANLLGLNNICVPNTPLKNDEIRYFQSVNDFVDIKLKENQMFYYKYNNTENKYINIINDFSNNNNRNIKPNINNNKEYTLRNQNKNKNDMNNIKNKLIDENESNDINNALKSLKIFAIGNFRNNEIQRQNSPNSLRTFNTNNRASNIYPVCNNDSFTIDKEKKVIYNNKMYIDSPRNTQRDKDRNSIKSELNKSPMNNQRKIQSPKKTSPENNLRNKNINKENKQIKNNNTKKLKIEEKKEKKNKIIKVDLTINKKPKIEPQKLKSPERRKVNISKSPTKEKRKEPVFLSYKEEEKDLNKSFDDGKNNKRNRYRNLFNENNEKDKSYITDMKKKKQDIMKLNPYINIGKNKKENGNNIKEKYATIENVTSPKIKKENVNNINIHKSPTVFTKKKINEIKPYKKKFAEQNNNMIFTNKIQAKIENNNNENNTNLKEKNNKKEIIKNQTYNIIPNINIENNIKIENIYPKENNRENKKGIKKEQKINNKDNNNSNINNPKKRTFNSDSSDSEEKKMIKKSI